MEGDAVSDLCLCQQDAYVRSLATTVLSCTPIESPPSSAAREGSSSKEKDRPKGCGSDGAGVGSSKTSPGPPSAPGNAAAAPAISVLYDVRLQESPFFPESGGQPCDAGQLVATRADGTTGAVNVTAVVWKEGAVCHVTDGPVDPGSRVEAKVDWQRRYDHMQQHTGQHVFSAVADLLLGADTASWELHPLDPEAHGSGDYGCVAVDLTLPNLTTEQLSQLEARANEELRALRAVTPLILDPRVRADVERMEALRSDPTFRGQLPPADKVKGGKLRLIHVEGLDINACGGTHVRSTGEVQLLKVVGAERTRGHTRVRVISGGRALAALAGCLGREAALTAKLTCPPARHGEMVELLLRDRRDGARARKILSSELAAHLGRALAMDSGDKGETPDAASEPKPPTPEVQPPVVAGPGPAALKGLGWAVLHRPSSDLDFLSLVASAALESEPGLQLLLLTADDTEPGAAPPSAKPGVEDGIVVTFLVAGQRPDVVKAVGAKVAEALGGRGGGRPGRYQGKATGLQRLADGQRAFVAAAVTAALS